MFKASDLSTALQSTEKPYTYLFKDTSSASNLLDMLPKQNGDVNIFINFFKLVFFLFNKQITVITMVMQTLSKFYLCFTKIKLFSGVPKLS